MSHNSFRAIGFHESRSPSSPYGPAPQGSQLITLDWLPHHVAFYIYISVVYIMMFAWSCGVFTPPEQEQSRNLTAGRAAGEAKDAENYREYIILVSWSTALCCSFFISSMVKILV